MLRFLLFTALILGVTSATPTSGVETSTEPLQPVEPTQPTQPATVSHFCPPCSASHEINATASPTPASFNHFPWLVHGMRCTCHPETRKPPRDDYHNTPGVGWHKLHTRAVVWNEARKLCNEEGGHLAIVNSHLEAHVMMKLFAQSGLVKDATYNDIAYIGIHDLYKEGEWVTIHGESLFKTGYTAWSDKWGGQPDNGSGNQHCGVFLKEGGLDDVNCNVAFAFFCELPVDDYMFH